MPNGIAIRYRSAGWLLHCAVAAGCALLLSGCVVYPGGYYGGYYGGGYGYYGRPYGYYR